MTTKTIDIPTDVQTVLDRLTEHGHEAYIVGGCVRDSLLGLTPKDYDVTTSANTEEIKEIFKDCKIINNNGLKHGTVTVKLNEESSNIEITAFKHSVDEENNILSDLKHRDFSINAIAYNVNGFVQLPNKAFFDDIENKVVKCVGKAEERFEEDCLRILRALRFASIYGFDIELDTEIAMRNMAHLINSCVAVERINSELNKILLGKNCRYVLDKYRDIIAAIIPEIKVMFNFDQKSKYHPNDLYTHTLNVVANVDDNLILRLAALFHDIGKPKVQLHYRDSETKKMYCHYYNHSTASYKIAQRILLRLNYPIKLIEEVLFLILYHDFEFTTKKKNARNLLKLINRHLHRKELEMAMLLLNLRKADRNDHDFSMSKIPLVDLDIVEKNIVEIVHEKECFSVSNLKVNGHDMMNLGYVGEFRQLIGTTLDAMVDAIVDESLINEKEDLIRFAKAELKMIKKMTR